MASLFEQIETLIGPDATAALLENLGGARVFIRTMPSAENPDAITRVLGIEMARLIGRAFGGEKVDLPSVATLERRRQSLDRRGEISRLFERGIRANEIATRVRCSRRYVLKVLNGK